MVDGTVRTAETIGSEDTNFVGIVIETIQDVAEATQETISYAVEGVQGTTTQLVKGVQETITVRKLLRAYKEPLDKSKKA